MKPIRFIDCETTGVDVLKDRIVSLAVMEVDSEQSWDWMFNPCVEMRPEVIAIHGITNEHAKMRMTFSELAPDIFPVLDGCDLAGFNLLNFDVPILWEEFHRCSIDWDLRGIHIIDVGNIFKKKEERTLSAAVKFYLGRDHDGAHGARADTRATIEVLDAQMTRYPDLTFLNVPALARFSRFEDRVDLAGKIVIGPDGDPIYNIGKAKGVKVLDDPGFGRWMLQREFSDNTKQAVRDILHL